ncbi:unnamed protein product [Phytomonas sp. Hart1]|nr:unnamed protein product [Phytomonas sp. Hart1]|eukprot:CCW70648.1 unnamed protein product [Phytomonas sp. isolate Hart1]
MVENRRPDSIRQRCKPHRVIVKVASTITGRERWNRGCGVLSDPGQRIGVVDGTVRTAHRGTTGGLIRCDLLRVMPSKLRNEVAEAGVHAMDRRVLVATNKEFVIINRIVRDAARLHSVLSQPWK